MLGYNLYTLYACADQKFLNPIKCRVYYENHFLEVFFCQKKKANSMNVMNAVLL
jgi:hypothetical protein